MLVSARLVLCPCVRLFTGDRLRASVPRPAFLYISLRILPLPRASSLPSWLSQLAQLSPINIGFMALHCRWHDDVTIVFILFPAILPSANYGFMAFHQISCSVMSDCYRRVTQTQAMSRQFLLSWRLLLLCRTSTMQPSFVIHPSSVVAMVCFSYLFWFLLPSRLTPFCQEVQPTHMAKPR